MRSDFYRSLLNEKIDDLLDLHTLSADEQLQRKKDKANAKRRETLAAKKTKEAATLKKKEPTSKSVQLDSSQGQVEPPAKKNKTAKHIISI